MTINKAISIRAPWWWFILHGSKDIENRDWATKVRGRVYVHASKRWVRSEIYCAVEVIIDVLSKVGLIFPWTLTEEFLRERCGCIVGSVEIVDCIRKSDSTWFFGEYGFVLRNPVAFETPVPCKGALGFFEVPESVMAELAQGGAR
jgi:hypothetical protein